MSQVHLPILGGGTICGLALNPARGGITDGTGKPPETSISLSDLSCLVCLINIACALASQHLDYCLCVHPMQNLIDWTGMECGWCLQPVIPATPETREIRTREVLAIFPGFPWLEYP
jgi:hypothetical protein